MKNIFDNPYEYIYKLRCGDIVIPIKSYSDSYFNLGKFEGYKFVDKYILFGEYKNSKYKEYYSYDDKIIDYDDYDWHNHIDNEESTIKLKCHNNYENDGEEYEIVAYKLCKDKKDMIDKIYDEDNIIWTWICDKKYLK